MSDNTSSKNWLTQTSQGAIFVCGQWPSRPSNFFTSRWAGTKGANTPVRTSRMSPGEGIHRPSKHGALYLQNQRKSERQRERERETETETETEREPIVHPIEGSRADYFNLILIWIQLLFVLSTFLYIIIKPFSLVPIVSHSVTASSSRNGDFQK